MKFARVRLAVFVLILCLLGVKSIARPVLFVTDKMIDQMKDRSSKHLAPWDECWDDIKAQADAGLFITSDPYDQTNGDYVDFRYAALDEAAYARSCAVLWHATGQKDYAEKAKDILYSWANNSPRCGDSSNMAEDPASDPDPGLNLALVATAFGNVYSLMYDYLSSSERTVIETWFSYLGDDIKTNHLHWIANNCYSGQNYNNHLSCHNMGMLAVGYATDDSSLISFATDSTQNARDFKEMLCGTILMSAKGTSQCYTADPDPDNVSDGEIYDRYRVVSPYSSDPTKDMGLSYSFYHTKFLLFICEMAYNNGLDLYSYTGPYNENLKLAFQYYSDFLIENDTTIKGGYYTDSVLNLGSVSLYEYANLRYPNTPEIEAVLKECNRNVAEGEINGCNGVLTHSRPVKPLIADWSSTTVTTGMDNYSNTRNIIADADNLVTNRDNDLVLGQRSSSADSAWEPSISSVGGISALDFDGSDTAYSNTAWENQDQLEIELDCYIRDTDSDQTLIAVTSSWEIRFRTSDQKIYFYVYDINGTVSAKTRAITSGQWIHVSANASSGNVKITADDEFDTTVTYSGQINECHHAAIYVGSAYLGARPLDGGLANIFVQNIDEPLVLAYNLEATVTVTDIYSNSRTAIEDQDGLVGDRGSDLILGQRSSSPDSGKSPSFVQGSPNYISFDGNDVAYAESAWPELNNFRVEFDFYPRSSSDQTLAFVTEAFEIRHRSDNKLYMYIHDDSGTVSASSASYSLNQWHSAVITVSDGIFDVAVDGTSGTAATYSRYVNQSHHAVVYMGNCYGETRPFYGYLSDIKIKDLEYHTTMIYWTMQTSEQRIDIYGNQRNSMRGSDKYLQYPNHDLILGQRSSSPNSTKEPGIATVDSVVSLVFDGGDTAYSECMWPESDEFRVEFDFYPEISGDQTIAYVNSSFELRHRGGGAMYMYLYTPEGLKTAISPSYTLLDWHHCIATVEDGEITVNIDGTDGTSVSYGGYVNQSYNRLFYLGSSSSETRMFTGAVDKFEIIDLTDNRAALWSMTSYDDFVDQYGSSRYAVFGERMFAPVIEQVLVLGQRSSSPSSSWEAYCRCSRFSSGIIF